MCPWVTSCYFVFGYAVQGEPQDMLEHVHVFVEGSPQAVVLPVMDCMQGVSK